MTVHEKISLTTAESALMETFGERVARLPGSGDTVAARDKALSMLRQNGLPTRKVEAWHYTDLRRLLASVPDYHPDSAPASVDPLLTGSTVVPIVNGKLRDVPAIAGTAVRPVDELLRAEVGGISIAPDGEWDAIGQINSAFVSGGIQILVDMGATLDDPVEIQSVHDGGQVHTRNLVSLGKGASGMFVDRHIGSDEDALATNVSELTLDEGAEATWIIVQEQGAATSHLAQLNVQLAEGAKLTLFAMNSAGRLVRQEIKATVAGEGADIAFRAVNLIGDSAHCDITLELDHTVANTTSTETVRNVVTGKGQGVFQGQIRVAQIAQKTDAQMACNTLLLSDQCGISVKPELEIFADDVICAHGATVTEIDEDHLFYLKARGITEKTARSLLVEAFVDEIVEELEHEELIEALEVRIAQWLETHG